MSVEEIILQHFVFKKIPICFDFPAGHIDDNRALIFGKQVELRVDNELGVLVFD
jgi:muramoyltetrapeptide carboxypeptidase